MHFKLWLEGVGREGVRKIVLDAVEATNVPEQTKDSVLGSRVSEQPLLLKNLKNYQVLAPYMAQIEEFITRRPNANLIALITFIDDLGRNTSHLY